MRSCFAFLLVTYFFAYNAFGEVAPKTDIPDEKRKVDFKADAPVDPEEKRKYGFGSIWSGKDNFFKNHFGKKREDEDVSLQARQVLSKSEVTKKDQMWEAALKVLKMFSLTYVNKEAGVIKTDESYVHEFDNTDSCKYKITVNISKDGKATVHITSSNDSQTRINKHEELLKSRITATSLLPDENKETPVDNPPRSPAKQESTKKTIDG